MRKFYLVAICILLPCGSSLAQSPDYPSFSLAAQIGGNPNVSVFHSDPLGVLLAKANVFRSFHTLTLNSEWDKSKLHFAYSCVYGQGPNSRLVNSPTYTDGEECPPGGAGASNFVRAIKITLKGTEAANYTLTSQCWLGFFNQQVHETLQPVASGEWCGRQAGGAPLEWISWIEIRLRRN